MKLTYLNKTVEINIPSTTKRLKQQVLEDFFDSYKDADKEPYENEEFLFKLGSFEGSSDIEEIPVNVIGQWMSGGADSSLLAYLLCKKIRDEELDIKFQPISVRRGRANNPIYAGNVIDFIEEDLGVDFILPHEVYYPPLDDEYMREIKIFWERDDIIFVIVNLKYYIQESLQIHQRMIQQYLRTKNVLGMSLKLIKLLNNEMDIDII